MAGVPPKGPAFEVADGDQLLGEEADNNDDEDLFEQDSLMFDDVDVDEDDQDGDDDDGPGAARAITTSSRDSRFYSDQPGMSVSSRLFGDLSVGSDEPDTPYGSPGSDMSGFDSIQKWTREVKKMLLDDQKISENRSKTGIAELQALSNPSRLSTEQELKGDLDTAFPTDYDFDILMPTTEELAEKYSNEMIAKETRLLQKEAHIAELERTQRSLKTNLEECQKELKTKITLANAGVADLKRSLEEKDRCIMETSEKLRKVTESYNSSEKRWKDQQDFLEHQIQKLKLELASKTTSIEEELEELRELRESSAMEKQSLEQLLENAKKDNDDLKRQLAEEKAALEAELSNLKEEKRLLEEQLRSEIEALQNKLTMSEEVSEQALSDRDAFKTKLESEQEKNRILILDVDALKDKDELVKQLQLEKLSLEESVSTIEREKGLMLQQFENEKYELELQVQTLKEQVEESKMENIEVGPVNFFRQEEELPTENWLEAKKSLEDRIAELELEKGNLLLQLVDVDEQEQQDEGEKVVEPTESERQLVTLQEDYELSLQKIDSLETELNELKGRESQNIEAAMSTIAWEEKLDAVMKKNEELSEELMTQRKAADELSGRYEELERKYAEMEAERPTVEGIMDIDKCDGWSDDTPQLPDEGFTEDPQITELKEALDSKQQEIEAMSVTNVKLDEELIERSNQIARYDEMLKGMTAEKEAGVQRFNECMKELETVRQELLLKMTELAEQQSNKKPAESGDGWADDTPALLEVGLQNEEQIAEIKEELKKKDEVLTSTTEKCRSLEEKLKKAVKALKQKNDKLAELKSRLGEDPMTASTMSPLEQSMTQEQLVTRTVTPDLSRSPVLHQEIEQWRRECETKETKIQELESIVKSLQDIQSQMHSAQHENNTGQQQMISLLEQRDMEAASLKNELAQLAGTLDSKNEEMEQLMKTCEDMQKSIDDKVELLNDCVAKKDEEVRQAISQYEDCLKDATLNVSHLTQELEAKIRHINQLHAQLQEAQESLLETQNEFDSFKIEVQGVHDSLRGKDQENEDRKNLEEQLRQELNRLQLQLNESTNDRTLIREALDEAEAERKRLREDSSCIQNEYSAKNSELQLKISSLMDQLNECETAVSVMETRLKESDDKLNEIRYALEEKTKAVENAEQTLFVKTEDCVRLEERIREMEEQFRRELTRKLEECNEEHQQALRTYTFQSNDLQQAYDQLAKKDSEMAELVAQCQSFQREIVRLQDDCNAKSMDISQKEQKLTEIQSLQSTIHTMEGTIASYTEALTTAHAACNEKIVELKNLELVHMDLEKKLETSVLAQEEGSRKLQERETTLEQTQHYVNTYYTEMVKFQGEAETMRQTNEHLQNQLTDTVDNLNTELNEGIQRERQLILDVENLRSQLTRFQNLDDNLNKYMEELNSASEELGKKNMEFRELEKVCKVRDTESQKLRAALETLKESIALSDAALLEKDERIKELEDEKQQFEGSRKDNEQTSSKYTKELLDELEEKTQEINHLRFEVEEGILQEKGLKAQVQEFKLRIQGLNDELNGKDEELEMLHSKFNDVVSTIPPTNDEHVAQRLKQSEAIATLMERKIDLLQVKLAEVESSEVKCYEDYSKLKILRAELEMDNLRMSGELEQLRRSLQAGDSDIKYKSMENQLVLMSQTLEDRDKLCLELLKNVNELQEAHDNLQIRVNELHAQSQPPRSLDGSLENQVMDQESQIFSLKIDLAREKKIRELFEAQLFLATSKKQFETPKKSNNSWNWLGEFLAPSPGPSLPASRPPSSTRSSLHPPGVYPIPLSDLSHTSLPLPSPIRPVTPVTPSTAFSASLFETPPPPQMPPQFSQYKVENDNEPGDVFEKSNA